MTAASIPDSLRILAVLRSFDEPRFTRLLTERRVNPRGLGDLLDLAEQLETPGNVIDSLCRLDWTTLRGLRAGAPESMARAEELLLAIDGELLPLVRSELDALLPSEPDFLAAAATDEAATTSGAAVAHRAAVLVNDALSLLDEAPRAVRTTRGVVRMSGVEVRRLATDLDTDPGVAGSIYRWLTSAGFIAPADDNWHPTELGRAVIAEPVTVRWRALVEAWLGELHLDEARSLTAQLGVDFPAPAAGHTASEPDDLADTATSAITLPGNADARLYEAEHLGLAYRGALTRFGALVFAGELDRAIAELEPLLPAEITQVYVQPDSTVIAPGPLPGALDARLREVATLERRALASEYRISPMSIAHALGLGRSEEEIRALLAELSLTGIPQPVDYLLTNTAERFGLVRVRARERGAARPASTVTALDARLLDALRVDTSLRALGFRAVDDALESNVSPETVLVTLLEARYPAVAEDADGAALPLTPLITAPPLEPASTATVARVASELAEQAGTDDVADDHSTWLQRRFELARRAKATVAVTVRVSDTETQTLHVIPTAVTPQRIRARDAVAEVERTLPLGSVLSVEEL